jgi:MATE family multidrug resistance protein
MWFANDNLKKILKLSVPLAATQLSLHFMGFVDVLVTGRISEDLLGAVGLGTTVFFTCGLAGLGIALALDPMISQALGSGDEKKAHHALWQGHYAAGFNALFLTALTWFSGYALRWMDMAPELYEGALIYIEGRLPGLAFFLFAMNLKSFLQSHHLTRPILMSAIVGNVVNLVGNLWLCGAALSPDWQFVVPPGALSLDAWGVGVASAVAGFIQMAWLLWPTQKASNKLAVPKVDMEALKSLYRLGLPISGQLILEIGSFTIVLLLMASESTTAAAAHQVALQITSLSFSICVGIGSAASVQVGRAVGMGSGKDMVESGWAAFGITSVLMLGSSLAMWFFPETISRIVTNQEEVIAVSSVLVLIAGFSQFGDGLQTVGAGVLRGLGITKFTLYANIIGHWVVGLPTGLVLTYVLDIGIHGLWWGLAAGLGTVALIYMVTFYRAQHRPIEDYRV